MTYEEAVAMVKDQAPDLTVETFADVPNAIIVSKGEKRFSIYKVDNVDLMEYAINAAKVHCA